MQWNDLVSPLSSSSAGALSHSPSIYSRQWDAEKSSSNLARVPTPTRARSVGSECIICIVYERKRGGMYVYRYILWRGGPSSSLSKLCVEFSENAQRVRERNWDRGE